MIPVFIEIFSGSARLARAVARSAGWLAMKWDILDGADYDLMRPAVQRLLKGWLRAGQIRAFHMGFPCASWSRARDCPNGPPRLRSPQHVLGLPGLRPSDQVKVETGNELVRFTARFCEYAIALSIPWTIECTGHVCRYTGRKHIVLSGKVPGETRFRTSVAEPYPPKLCARLARTFVDEAARTRAAHFSSMLSLRSK